MINNRQAGRRRGRGGGNNNNNGPRQGGQGNGSRIDNRARGNATQLHEKYKNMAADAQRAGDRVNTEYYLQFADHYFRVLSEQRGRFEDQQQPRARGREDYDFDGQDFGGEEYGDEGEPIRAQELSGDRDGNRDGNRDDRPQRDDRYEARPRDDRPRDDRPRDDRPRNDANGDGRQREFRRDGNGDGRPNDVRRERNEWQDRPDNRDARRDRQPPVEIAGQRRAEPPQPGESLEARADDMLAADRPLDAPARRRGRPPRAASVGDLGGEPAGIAADRLPPSLSASLTVAANDEDGGEPKPRRRRARPAEDTPTAAE